MKWSESHSVVSDSLWSHWLYSPWNSPDQNTGVDSHSLLQGGLPNPGIEPRSPTLQADSLLAEPPGKSDIKYIWILKSEFSHILFTLKYWLGQKSPFGCFHYILQSKLFGQPNSFCLCAFPSLYLTSRKQFFQTLGLKIQINTDIVTNIDNFLYQ